MVRVSQRAEGRVNGDVLRKSAHYDGPLGFNGLRADFGDDLRIVFGAATFLLPSL